MSLVENINARKKAGTSRSKANSTISDKAYADMKAGWKKKGAYVGKSKKKFKPHKMYDKNGKSYMANTMEDHLRMKKKGYSHMGAFFGKKKKKAKEAEVKSDSTANMSPAEFQAFKLKRMKEGKMRTTYKC